jgi:preprotein translocase subunit SecA
MGRLGMTEGQQIESGMVSRAIEKAQKKVEDYNFEIRKSLLEYDEVMDKQRKTIYGVRQEVLESVGLQEKVQTWIETSTQRATALHKQDAEGFKGWCQRTFGFEISDAAIAAATADEPKTQLVIDEVLAQYAAREAEVGEPTMRRVEQYLLLNAIDGKWKDHLHALDALKTGIGLRSYGQLDPKNEYKREGFELFEHLMAAVEDEVTSLVLRIKVEKPQTAA